MWPWRRRSPFYRVGLPEHLFISHSYQDREAREWVVAHLPKRVKPYIFPPIVVPPEQMVSNALIEAILSCDGLIYLEGGHSAQSFWVAFERDYALRAKKRVFAVDILRQTVRQDTSEPLALPIFACYSRQSQQQIDEIKQILWARHVDIEQDELGFGFLFNNPYFASMVDAGLDPVLAVTAQITSLDKQLDDGGYIVVFWNLATSESGSARAYWGVLNARRLIGS